jgi:chitodextrinase
MRPKVFIACALAWGFAAGVAAQSNIQNTYYPPGTTVVSNGNITAGNNVTVPNGSNVIYQATQWVRLTPGFYVVGGGTFRAQLIGADTTPPSQPGAIVATNITTTSFTLSWGASSDNVGVAGYEVQINSTVYGTTGGTSINVTGRAPNTTYVVSVRAYDAAGNNSVPRTDSVTTINGPDGDDDGDGIPNNIELQLGTVGYNPPDNNSPPISQLKVHRP